MELDRKKVTEVLNEIVELELAGAVRYTQYSLMVFGHAVSRSGSGCASRPRRDWITGCRPVRR
jgi:bacterioferritin (cytochrome b1)